MGHFDQLIVLVSNAFTYYSRYVIFVQKPKQVKMLCIDSMKWLELNEKYTREN